MKRVIPFLLLACVAVACKEDGPTVPALHPQFGKPNCDIDPSHPSCNGGGGGGDTGAYIATPLGRPKMVTKARDLGEGPSIVISGVGEQDNGDPVGVRWTVTEAGIDGPTPLLLGSFPVSEARGVNDAGTVIVGIVGSGMGGVGGAHILDQKPVAWSPPSGSPVPLYIGDHRYGDAFDVNDDGLIVGTTGMSYSYSAATLWNTDGSVYALMPPAMDDGLTMGMGINNEGYVVGYGSAMDPHGEPWHALLWRPGDGSYTDAPCDLHDAAWGEQSSAAYGVTDVTSDGHVFVNGASGGGVIWKVHVTTCDFSVVHHLANAKVHDVALVANEAQAVGMSAAGDQPVRWLISTGDEVVLSDAQGYALAINRTGSIVGWTKFKGSERATLWKPNSN